MFGKEISRKCYECNHISTRVISTIYRVENEQLFTGVYCDKCNKDLCEKDKETLKEAKEKNKKISIFMM